MTGLALNYAYLSGFEYSRREAFKVVVFITGGKSQDDTTLTLKIWKNQSVLSFSNEEKIEIISKYVVAFIKVWTYKEFVS